MVIGIFSVLLLCPLVTVVIFSIMKAMSRRRKNILGTQPTVPDNGAPFMNRVSDNLFLMCHVHFN